MSTLVKTVVKSYVPGSPGVPASPGSPAVPKYSYTETRRICSVERFLLFGGDGTKGGAFYGRDVGFYSKTPVFTCRTVTNIIVVPATPEVPPTPGVPPTPDQVVEDFNLGWNSGARSIASFERGGFAQFQLRATGAVVGLNDADNTAHFSEIKHAFFVTNGVVRIYESGAEKLYVGFRSADSLFRIERRAQKVIYSIDGEEVYRSEASTDAPLFLDASLYSGGDNVASPMIGPLAYAEGSLSSLVGSSSDDGFAYSAGALSPLQGNSHFAPYAHTSFSPLVGSSSDGLYGYSAGELAPLTGVSGGSASGEALPSYGLSSGSLSMLSGSATGLTGEVGEAETSLLALVGMSSDYPSGVAATSLPALDGFSHAYEGLRAATLGEFVLSGDPYAALFLHFVTLNATVEITDALFVEAIYSAVIDALVRVSAGTPPEMFDPGEVWTVNLDSGAQTMYENFSFNSFAVIDGYAYGVKADGLYRLDGEDDAGVPIRASLNFGKRDFGTQHKKGIPYCYIGVSSTNKLVLKVTVNGQEYLYTASSVDDELDVQRFKLGRGLRSTYFTFELFNKDGADFELDNIEFHAITLSRRL